MPAFKASQEIVERILANLADRDFDIYSLDVDLVAEITADLEQICDEVIEERML